MVPPEELKGATITLSNFGMFGGRYAHLVIVPPQVAIIGAGRVREKVVPHKGVPAIRRSLPLTLLFDHRAVTGGEDAFLRSLKRDSSGRYRAALPDRLVVTRLWNRGVALVGQKELSYDQLRPGCHRRLRSNADRRVLRRTQRCSSPMLGATAIRAAVARAGLGPEAIGETVMGCVLPAGLGQAPGRQAALGAGIPVCGGSYDRQQDVRLRHESSDVRP